jgi:hypothetical protein
MEYQFHSFQALFEQLGLDSRPDQIRLFLETHAPLPHALALHDAPFWSPAQASFLREAVQDDGDWAEVVDALNAALNTAPA